MICVSSYTVYYHVSILLSMLLTKVIDLCHDPLFANILKCIMETNEPSEKKKQLTNEHLANERTLLAWVRTAIGIMAFGFVVVKFSLFIRQMAIITGTKSAMTNHGISGPVGILLVIAGAGSLVFGAWRYFQTERRLKIGFYHHQSGILYAFVMLILILSIVIIIYLFRTT